MEKGLAATRPAAKQKALEVILLYIELDRPDPIVDELIPMLSHKQPKIITATLAALTQIYRNFGCKTVEPKPTLKLLPKVFGHADKNVRTEAQNLTVEFYRWLKDAMKPFFWNDLKPVQQQDLEKLFEKIKEEPPPKQGRWLRSQRPADDAPAPSGADDHGGDDEEAEIDLEPEYETVNVFPGDETKADIAQQKSAGHIPHHLRNPEPLKQRGAQRAANDANPQDDEDANVNSLHRIGSLPRLLREYGVSARGVGRVH